MLDQKLQHAHSFSSLSKAFSNLNSKTSPLVRISQIVVQGTGADFGPLFQLQSRPVSSDGLMSIFKPDPQKKIEKEHAKEYASKVRIPASSATGAVC